MAAALAAYPAHLMAACARDEALWARGGVRFSRPPFNVSVLLRRALRSGLLVDTRGSGGD